MAVNICKNPGCGSVVAPDVDFCEDCVPMSNDIEITKVELIPEEKQDDN